MAYKLNPKLVPFLKKNEKTGEYNARLTGVSGANGVLELDEGVSAKVKVKDLGIELKGATGADLVFDVDGVMIASKVDEPPKVTKTTSRGSTGSPTRRQTPAF